MSVNFTGAWRADLSRSRFQGPALTSVSIRIVHSGSELHEEMTVIRADGREERITFQCAIGTERGHRLNGEPIRGSAKWEGNELVIESFMQAGTRELHFCDYWSLSSDGQTLFMEHRNDDLAGQLAILERVE